MLPRRLRNLKHLIEQMSSLTDSVPEAIFIGGCPRSGTTLLASLLGATGGCVVTPESQFKQEVIKKLRRSTSNTIEGKKLRRFLENNIRFRQWSVELSGIELYDQMRLKHFGRVMLQLAAKFGSDSKQSKTMRTWIDHTPQNIETGLSLLKMIPNSRFIHIVRDPRAVAASMLQLNWGPSNIEGVAKLWNGRVTEGLALAALINEKLITVRYEDLCENTEETISGITQRFNLKRETIMAVPNSKFLISYTEYQHRLVGQMPKQERVKAWEKELGTWEQYRIEQETEVLMDAMGYERANYEIDKSKVAGIGARYIKPIFRGVLGKIRHKLRKRFFAPKVK